MTAGNRNQHEKKGGDDRNGASERYNELTHYGTLLSRGCLGIDERKRVAVVDYNELLLISYRI